MKNKLTVEEKKKSFLTELSRTMGIKTLACRRVGIGRTMLYQYIDKDAEFALKVKEIEESMKDFAESKLHELVVAGDRAAIMFYLKAKAKDRGYR